MICECVFQLGLAERFFRPWPQLKSSILWVIDHICGTLTN